MALNKGTRSSCADLCVTGGDEVPEHLARGVQVVRMQPDGNVN